MARLNRFEFIGNLTRDAELRNTGGGKSLGTISLAVDDEWVDGSGKVQKTTEYFRVTVWEKTAVAAHKHLGKGSSVYVQGRIQNSKYEKDGADVYVTNYNVDDIQYLSIKAPQSASDEAQ